MRLLILGGTRFLGRHLAEQALAAGHALTLLHRGHSGPGLFPDAEHLIADRDGDLSLLAGRQWDVAIDTNAYVPRQVRSVAALLAGEVGQYQLVSTISVYAKPTTPGITEDAPLATLPDPGVEDVTGATYGGLKVLCEQAAQAAFGAQCLVSRPGLLVGPHDPTGRFTWWVTRMQRGGEVLAPGLPDAPVQFIDARDAAAWHLQQALAGTTGVFNLSGPTEALTMGGLLSDAATLGAGAANPTHLTWVDEAFVLGQGVAPWSDLPVWLPAAAQALHQIDIRRAIATGLRCRALIETLQDTAAWAAGTPNAGGPMPAPGGLPRPAAGLEPEREAALLAAWHALQAGERAARAATPPQP
jgi:2'-hydroxyisoflavone reductase